MNLNSIMPCKGIFFLFSEQALQTPGQHTPTNNTIHSTGVFLLCFFFHTRKADFQSVPHASKHSLLFVCVCAETRARFHAGVGAGEDAEHGGHVTKTENGDAHGQKVAGTRGKTDGKTHTHTQLLRRLTFICTSKLSKSTSLADKCSSQM